MQVTIDNCTSSNYSVVSIVCVDRKGLIYDLMRTLKDIHVRVAYAKIKVHGNTAETDLFVEEADGLRMKERSRSSTSHITSPCAKHTRPLAASHQEAWKLAAHVRSSVL